MAGKEEVLTFTKSFFSPPGLRKRYNDVFPKLIDSGSLKVSIDVSFPVPSSGVDLKTLKKRGDSSLSKFNKLFDKQFDEAFPSIAEDYNADQQGDPKAYSKAADTIKTLNEYVEEMLDTLRVELRKGVAEVLKVDARNLSTIGTEDFRKFNLIRGVFKGDDPNAADSEDYTDLAAALKKGQGKWHYCGIAANGTMAYIVVDRKKPVKRSALKELKEALGGSAVVMKGICYPQGTKVDIHLLKESPKEPKCVHLKDGLKAQIGKSIKVLPVKLDLDAIPTVADLSKLDANGKLKGKEKETEKEKKK